MFLFFFSLVLQTGRQVPETHGGVSASARHAPAGEYATPESNALIQRDAPYAVPGNVYAEPESRSTQPRIIHDYATVEYPSAAPRAAAAQVM